MNSGTRTRARGAARPSSCVSARRSTKRPLLAMAVIAMLATAACSTTVDDAGVNEAGDELSDEVEPLDSGVIVDDEVPVTTVAILGSAAELLPEIGIDMSRLSAQISDEGGEDETLARIEANWAAISAEVERDRPELVGNIQTTIDMARTAVERKRPADADKAFSILRDLVDSFTGDS
jgi:hypothetical protein